MKNKVAIIPILNIIIQRHATYLSEELQKGLLFMKVHGACDKLWEEGRLGCHWITY